MDLTCEMCVRLWEEYAAALRGDGSAAAIEKAILAHEQIAHPPVMPDDAVL